MESISMYQIILLGSFVVCTVIGSITILSGMMLLNYLKKPFGQKLIKLGIILGIVGTFFYFIAIKNYLLVVLELLIIYAIRKRFKSGIQ